VEEEDPRHHVIHTERYHVPAETMAACAAASRVVAVGTTAVRALETAAATGRLEGRSSLFIYPPFEWRVVDVMMTNFHLPRTTLLMMIGAFVGPRWRELYEVALAEQYRFLSFGDAMLLPRTADGPARER
jgi:S-adenosylmethionine:tRNA ribosyltransferase-isomerase